MTTVTSTQQEKRKTLLLVGAGHTNTQAIIDKLFQACRTMQCILINDVSTAVYSGILPAVIARIIKSNTVGADIDLPLLCKEYNVKLILGRVIRIDGRQNQITFISNGINSTLKYDVLSINIGSRTKYIDNMYKFTENNNTIILTRPISKLLPSLRSFESDSLLNNSEKKVWQIVIIGSGAAGIELTFSIYQRFLPFSDSTKTFEIVLISNNNQLLPNRSSGLSHNIQSEFRKRGIKYMLNTKATRFEKADELIITSTIDPEEKSMHFDLCIVATGASPPELLLEKNHDLKLCKKGWISVKNTLQTIDYSNILACGDCISFASDPSYPEKAGVFAVRQAPTLIHNMSCLLSGNKVNLQSYHAQTDYLSIISMADGRAIGTKFGISFKGHWVFKFKMYLDQSWQKRFQVPLLKGSTADSDANDELYCGSAVEAAAILSISNEMKTDDSFDTQLSILKRMDVDDTFKTDVVMNMDSTSSTESSTP